MSSMHKWAASVFAVAALLVALAAILLSRVDAGSRVEELASQATGLTVAVGGGASVRLFPTAHLVLSRRR